MRTKKSYDYLENRFDFIKTKFPRFLTLFCKRFSCMLPLSIPWLYLQESINSRLLVLYNTEQQKLSKRLLVLTREPWGNPIFRLSKDTSRFFSNLMQDRAQISKCKSSKLGQKSQKVSILEGICALRDRLQLLNKILYRLLSKEVSFSVLNSFKFSSFQLYINFFGANTYCAKHKVAR